MASKEMQQNTLMDPSVHDKCLQWAAGTGPIYDCSLTDLWQIFIFTAGHGSRCWRGVPADTLSASPHWLQWGGEGPPDHGLTPAQLGYTSPAQVHTDSASWQNRITCITDLPFHLKALLDPLHLSGRTLDPAKWWE